MDTNSRGPLSGARSVGICAALLLAGGRSRAQPAPAKPSIDAVLFSSAEIAASYPAPSGGAYHDWRHAERTAEVIGALARARGLSREDAKFVTEVALLHDFDPTRTPGTLSRVPETLARLNEDFAGAKSLTGEPGRSALKERLGWDARRLKMAEAMIQRLEFPFADNPGAAYKGTSPLARYEAMLRAMPARDRLFVLREAALLRAYGENACESETARFPETRERLERLLDEINRTIAPTKLTLIDLGNDAFLNSVGTPGDFADDLSAAKKLGTPLSLPDRAAVFALLPRYGRTFAENLAGFSALYAALRAGDPRAVERALQAAADAGTRKPARFSSKESSLEARAAAWKTVERLSSDPPDLPGLQDVRAWDEQGRPVSLEKLASDFRRLTSKEIPEVTFDFAVGAAERIRATIGVEEFGDKTKKSRFYIKSVRPTS